MTSNKERTNPNLYDAFHRDVDHETEDCRDLKRDIENLIKQGHLRQFICEGRREDCQHDRRHECQKGWRDRPTPTEPYRNRKEDQYPRDRSLDQDPGLDLAGVINTIYRSPTRGDGQNSKKRTYRQSSSSSAKSIPNLSQVISYGPDNLVPTVSNNYEALIIGVVTNNYLVKKGLYRC